MTRSTKKLLWSNILHGCYLVLIAGGLLVLAGVKISIPISIFIVATTWVMGGIAIYKK